MDFLNELSIRNYPLYLFGWVSLVGFIASVILMSFSDTQVLGINAWIKPAKFYLSTVLFVWTMGWFTGYLDRPKLITAYNIVVISVLAFELIYISWQASLGQQSHFNINTQFNALMWSLMGSTISIMTLFTAVIGWFFFKDSFPDLSPSYLWGIRLGIITFVIFAFEGGIMGALMSHTVGAEDGATGITFLNWSLSHGDLRIAHFIGMHALQVLPVVGFYLMSQPRGIWIASAVYFLLALFVLIKALQGIPLFRQGQFH